MSRVRLGERSRCLQALPDDGSALSLSSAPPLALQGSDGESVTLQGDQVRKPRRLHNACTLCERQHQAASQEESRVGSGVCRTVDARARAHTHTHTHTHCVHRLPKSHTHTHTHTHTHCVHRLPKSPLMSEAEGSHGTMRLLPKPSWWSICCSGHQRPFMAAPEVGGHGEETKHR